jgi:putative hemolysin
LDPYITFKLLLLFCLFLLSALFASSEASLFSLTPLHLHKMKEEGSRRLVAVQNLLRHPRRLLITIIVGNESVNVMISALTAAIFIHFLGDDGKWVAVAALTPLLLVFGEAIPKTMAKIRPIPTAQGVAPFLSAFSTATHPAVRTLEKLSAWMTGTIRTGRSDGREGLTEGEFRVLIDAGHEEGVLEKSHRDLIHRVFELGDTDVETIMTPRIDMFCLPLSLGMEDLKKKVLDGGYSRVPVYGTDRDDILGILYAKDLLQGLVGEEKEMTLMSLLKQPYFVPLEKRADSLLRDFQTRKIHLAVVVDEYGGVAGLVTMEDILECLFGEIYDERDIQEKLYHVIDDHHFVVSGRMPIGDFNALAGTAVSSEAFDTLGGFVFHLFGRLPSKGDEIGFDGMVFRVERMRGSGIWRIRVTTTERTGAS